MISTPVARGAQNDVDPSASKGYASTGATRSSCPPFTSDAVRGWDAFALRVRCVSADGRYRRARFQQIARTSTAP